MFQLNGFWLHSACPVQMGYCCSGRCGPDGGVGIKAGGLRCSAGELGAVLCQPVVYRGLITQWRMEKLLEGN